MDTISLGDGRCDLLGERQCERLDPISQCSVPRWGRKPETGLTSDVTIPEQNCHSHKRRDSATAFPWWFRGLVGTLGWVGHWVVLLIPIPVFTYTPGRYHMPET